MIKVKNDSRISLLVEGYPRNGYQTYSKLVGRSTSGLCISRLHPDYVAQKYDLEMSKRYWLSNQSGEENIAPKSLNQLVKVVRSELRGRSGSKIFLDGLEYLLLFNDMNKVLDTLSEIDSLLKAARAELVMAIDPLTFEQKDLERMWGAFPRYTAEELLAKYSVGGSINIPTSIGAERERSDVRV
ncbi:MAG: DUF835 domain-containing protein [Methanomassiliicoccus sp.]|nr:DUF835 domain-containing protein [Methanomassiliicoccus sp.]